MLYPFGKGAPGSVEEATDKTAEEQGFKVFVYQTDGRKPLIIHPKDDKGMDLPGDPVDPKTYVKDKYGDVIAEQSYGDHPTIPGMWYRKGWVRFDPQPTTEPKGQMMPINESGQPIHPEWKDPNRGWKGETIDGVSGATIRPLIVRDWIQQARDFDAKAQSYDFPTSLSYDEFVGEFNKHIVPANDLTIEGTKIPSVVGITNSQTEFFINKVDQDGKPLEGAEFELFKLENGVELEPGIKPSRTAKNQFIFDGLKEGVYHLKETKTPEGYQEPTTYWEITVNKEGAVTKKEEKPITTEATNGANKAQALAQPVSNAPLAMMAMGGNSLLAPIPERLSSSPLAVEGSILPTLRLLEPIRTSQGLDISPNSNPVPVGAGEEHYADENRKNDQNNNPDLQDVYNPTSDGTDLQLGVWITEISSVNGDSGWGTFKARIYIDPTNTALADQQQAGSEPAAQRYLKFNLGPNLTLTKITEYSLNQNNYRSVNFTTNVSGLTGKTSRAFVTDKALDSQNRLKLNYSPVRTRYVVLVEGTYDIESMDPVKLDVSYQGKLKKPDEFQHGRKITYPMVDSHAQATSQVYHYDRYLVTYDGNGGIPASSSETVRHGRSVANPPAVTRDKHQFLGWKESGQDVNLSDPAYTHVTADHTLFASWRQAAWTVSFYEPGYTNPFHTVDVDDGQSLGDKLLTVVDLDPDLVKEKEAQGLQFAGWEDGNGKQYFADTIINGDLALYPKWETIKKHYVYFVDHDRNVVLTQGVPYGKTYLEAHPEGLPDPIPKERPGYTFEGWKDYYWNDFKGDKAITQNMIVYPNWEKTSQIILTFHMLIDGNRYRYNQDLDQPISLTSGESLAKNDVPKPNPETRDGYTFSGWKKFDTGLNDYVDIKLEEEKFTENVDLYGYWIPSVYTVTFKNGDDSRPFKVNHGEYVTAPSVQTREGWIFKGWKDGDKTFDPSQPVTASATYTAVWEEIQPEQVSVSFNSEGGSPVATQVIKKGGTISEPAAPTKKGYTFAGWMLGSQAFDFNTPINKSIALTASWTKNPDPGTMNELIVKNLKKEFEGEFSIDKFQKLDNKNRVKLGGTYFSFTKREGAELPESFDPAAYAKKYDNPYWDVDKGFFKTDSNGKIAFNHLQPGVYDLKEEKSPDGYLANPEKYVIVVNKIGNTIIVPESGYDPDKYPVEVDHGTEPTPDPNQPTKRTETKSLDGELVVEDYKLKTSAEDGVIRPLKDQRFSMEYTIRLPEDTIPGDTFTITLDKHLNWGGIRIDPEKVQDIVTEHGQVVATTQDNTQDENGNVVRKITYTLTDYVANRTDIVIHQTVPVYVDHNEVTNSTGLTFTNTIGGAAKTSESIWVDFRPYYGTGGYVDSDLNWPLGGKHQGYENYLGGWFYENRAKKEIELYYYVFGENISWSTDYTLNMEAKNWLRNTPSDVIYNDPSRPVKVSVYKVDAFTASGRPNTTAMPPSYGPRIMDLKDENRVMTDQTFVAGQDGIIRIPLDVNKDYPDGRFGYIVKAVAPFDGSKDQVDLYTYAKLSHKTNFYYRDFWNREYDVESSDGAVTYWNYLHRYTATSGASAQDLVDMTLTKRELLGKEGEDKNNTKLIPGAGFKLTNNQGFQDYAVTGSDGTVKFTKLKPGNYFLEEVLTPKGYTPVNVVWDIQVAKDGTITVSDPGDPSAKGLIEGGKNSLAVWNRKTPIDKPVLQFPNIPNRIEFTKVGESGTPLEGATLELRKSDTAGGTYVVVTAPNGPRISGSDGKLFWTNLAPGYYQVWETKAPAGYVTPSKEVATFRVDTATGEIKDLQIHGRDPVGENMIRNLRPMKMALRKVDDKKLDITEGTVTFAVSAAPGNNNPVLKELQTITVDLTKAGPYVREIPGSMNGKYILSEMTPPSGYVKTTQQYEIEIDQDKRTISLTKVTDGKNEVPYLDKGLLSKAGSVILYQEGVSDQISLDIVNHLLYTLPTTAGPGTFLFTLAGAFLLGLAFSLFRQTKGPSGRPRKRLPFLRRQLE